MRAGLIRCVLTMVLVAAAGQTPAWAETDCKAAYEAHLKTDLVLDYQAFDQTQHQGFRALGDLACHAEAADLIEAYIAHTQAKQSSLKWHIAQLRAHSGDYAAALRYAEQSIDPEESLEKDRLRWNDYVLATMAFLKHDKASLLAHRAKVEADIERHRGNGMNLRLLDAFVKYFDSSYAEAMQHIEK
ncbi:hypothetical protein KSF73_07220 [Burkholderiaceae bacterium DAT-1]|nr:hypothetical protein [Burkholderiaceae bacterium DAT-1]